MNGVEAAASLFGSEESDSDLFATLGADTTPNQFSPANLFFSHEPSSTPKFNSSLETQSHSQVGEPTSEEFPAYTSPDHLFSDDHEHNGHGGHWNKKPQENIDDVTYSNEVPTALNAPAEVSNQSYTPRPSLPQSNPNYLPPALLATTNPGTISSYSPYNMPSNPPPAAHVAQQQPVQVSLTQPYLLHHTPPVTTQYLGASSLPVTPNTKPIITRPKYSNAYDPPFIPSSSRRTGRTGGAQHSYQHPQTTPYYAENNHTLSGIPPNQHYPAQPTNANILDSPGTKYSGDTSLQSQRQQSNSYLPEPLHNASDPYSVKTQEGLHEDSARHTSSHGAIDPSSSLKMSPPYQESALTEASNFVDSIPSSIPASPPVSQYDIGTFAQTGNLNGYVSQRMPSYKREVTAGAKDNYDPYAPKVNHAPTNHIPRTSSPLSGFNRTQNESTRKSFNPSSNLSGQSSASSIGVSPSVVSMHTPRSLNTTNDEYSSRHSSQRLDLKLQDTVKVTNAQYAPSPSLLGSNDPLARTSARAPVVTFGFGGKMVTCFHGMPGLNAGFDVALSSRTSSELKIHILHKLLPASALNAPSSSYPGPLLSDPGTPSLSLVRPSLSAQTKAKKAAIVGYLSGRADEIDRGLGYLANLEKRAARGTLILVKLLKIMVENDGRLLGTSQAESAVRAALVPRLDGSATAIGNAVSSQAVYNGISFDEAPLTVMTLRPSALDRIQELLVLGDRRQAYQFAMDQNLWAHAMVIASSIDKDAWKEVVNDFLRTELGAKDDIGLSSSTMFNDPAAARKGNWEGLRVAYSLFSGQGAASVKELVPSNSLQRATGGHQPPAGTLAISPRTPNFSSLQAPVPIPPESLSKWAETVAMMLSSPLPSETSIALTAFGDQLLVNNWVQAAHACYLLSPQTSLMGGLGSPSARITLLGSKNLGDATKDPDALILTEILEFAMSLTPISKGQENLSYLQAYRFIRAVSLAESGHVQLATRYCEAISTSLNHASPYTTNAMLEQLQGLSQRLIGVHNDKAGSWIGGKLSKPSLDTIGGWLEGRFTKLVTGDSDTVTLTGEETKSRDHPFAGPFAHYSTISSTTPSARSSPQPSFSNLSMPPPRTSSAMATSSEYAQVQVERSPSAMGYVQQTPDIHTSISSFSSSHSSPTGFAAESQYQLHDPHGPKSQPSPTGDTAETTVHGTWWGSDADNSNRTPTAATFMQIDESVIQPNADGFISLMDSHSFSVGPHQLKQETSGFLRQEDEGDDDLGLSNSKSKTVELDSEARESPTPVPESKPAAPPQTEAQAPAGGSWLGRWWKRSDTTTSGPVKASLGEENTFYYDKEQKRWVNKKAGSEETPKPAPPPPPRAQTASPGMGGSRASPVSGPPVRSASAIDLGSEPPTKAPVRIRSNLAPPTESAPVTPAGPRLNSAGPPPGSLPPPGRPKSQTAKRNIRSRYVDVFQQEGSADA